jgi:hypothetical protein
MDAATMPLQVIGSQDAASCDGDVCAIPVHHEQAVVNRALDSDRV